MNDMKKYYLALVILIPIYIATGFVASRSEIFNYFNIALLILWVAAVFAFYKSKDFQKMKKKTT
jgi:hypothetical protein